MTSRDDILPEAIILAGGLGTRLRPVVGDRPKPLAEIAGRPFLELLFERLIAAGYGAATLSVGYRAGQIEARFGDRFGPLALRYALETEPLGTGGGLRNALAATTAEPLLVMNGDSVCAADLGEFRRHHLASGAAASLMLAPVAERGRYGVVDMADDGRVTAFRPRPAVAVAGPGLINAGVYLLSRAVIAAIPQGRAVSLETETFPALAETGQLRGWIAGDAAFIDIGTPESLAAAPEFFGLSPRPPS